MILACWAYAGITLWTTTIKTNVDWTKPNIVTKLLVNEVCGTNWQNANFNGTEIDCDNIYYPIIPKSQVIVYSTTMLTLPPPPIYGMMMCAGGICKMVNSVVIDSSSSCASGYASSSNYVKPDLYACNSFMVIMHRKN